MADRRPNNNNNAGKNDIDFSVFAPAISALIVRSASIFAQLRATARFEGPAPILTISSDDVADFCRVTHTLTPVEDAVELLGLTATPADLTEEFSTQLMEAFAEAPEALAQVFERECAEIILRLMSRFHQTEITREWTRGLDPSDQRRYMAYLEYSRNAAQVYNNVQNIRNVMGDLETLDNESERQINQFINENCLFERMRRFRVRSAAPIGAPIVPLRLVGRARNTGQMVTFKGMVVSISAPQPQIIVDARRCANPGCGRNTYTHVCGREFRAQTECTSDHCKQLPAAQRQSLVENVGASVFGYTQTVRLQELSSEVPPAGVPRIQELVLTNELVDAVSAGDSVTVTGIPLPVAHALPFAFRLGHNVETFISVQSITSDSQVSAVDTMVESEQERFSALQQVLGELANEPAWLNPAVACRAQLTAEEVERCDALLQRVLTSSVDSAGRSELYEAISNSICPDIYGHEDIKNALTLLLVGAPVLMADGGVRMRGDVNILLIGDPGVAKSQMLRACQRAAPRCVYVTGRGASGAGLTAAVVRDPVTGAFTLEPGALVLADNGLAIIDEFDKLPDEDLTAVHETMEQQTVSISKAGINATLNARASVLAAANPAYGRYNTRRSVQQNINLQPALLSRFDLTFVILDRVNRDRDAELTDFVMHIAETQQLPTRENSNNTLIFNQRELRYLVAVARTYRPLVPDEAADSIAALYVQLRRDDERTAAARGGLAGDTFTTPRTLMSVIRLSQAHARCCLLSEVTVPAVEEAQRLMESARAPLRQLDTERLRPAADSITQRHQNVVAAAAAGRPRLPAAGAPARARVVRAEQQTEQAWTAIRALLREANHEGISREAIISQLVPRFTRNVIDETLQSREDAGLVFTNEGNIYLI